MIIWLQQWHMDSDRWRSCFRSNDR